MKESDNDFLNSSFEKTASFKSGVIRRIQSSTSFLSLSKYNVAIQLLDDSEIISNEFGKNTTGRDILDLVCSKLEIQDKDYFGLRYNSEFKHRFWFDLNKSLNREFHHENLGLCFRFRFYPIDPVDLNDAVVKDLLCVQLQRDLLHGRLQCTQDTAAQLGALILQGNIGDYDEEKSPSGYVSGYKLILKQSEKLEERIADVHRSYRGWSKDDAFDQFLRIASRLDTYGFDPYTVKTLKNDINVVIGGTPKHLVAFVFNQIVYRIPWKYINDVDYSRRNVVLALSDSYFTEFLQQLDVINPEKILNGIPGPIALKERCSESLLPLKNKKGLKFTCPKSAYAKHLWKHLLSQKFFYNAASAKDIKPKFSKSRLPLIRGSLFRCPTAKTMKEMTVGSVTGIEKSYSCHTQKPRTIINAVRHSISSIQENGDGQEDEIQQEADVVEEYEIKESWGSDVKELRSERIDNTPGPDSNDVSQTNEVHQTHNMPIRTKKNGVNYNVYNATVKSQKKLSLLKVMSSMLTLLLIFLIISGVIFAVFEMPSAVTMQIPYLVDLRHRYYLPLKTKIIKMLNL